MHRRVDHLLRHFSLVHLHQNRQQISKQISEPVPLQFLLPPAVRNYPHRFCSCVSQRYYSAIHSFPQRTHRPNQSAVSPRHHQTHLFLSFRLQISASHPLPRCHYLNRKRLTGQQFDRLSRQIPHRLNRVHSSTHYHRLNWNTVPLPHRNILPLLRPLSPRLFPFVHVLQHCHQLRSHRCRFLLRFYRFQAQFHLTPVHVLAFSVSCT
mmetsp:Transcript_9694/g.15610  ORF Transcript_9694/g.15610 Transcript_9694/m.15610 type:complete len:208 (-) Transcript_9694:619-1242(-)